VNKITATSATQLANYNFASCLFTYTAASIVASAQTKTSYRLAYLTSWHNNTFDYKLRSIKAENP